MTSNDDFPFGDPRPRSPVEASEEAIEAFRKAAAKIAAKSIEDAFTLAYQLSECRSLSVGDAVPLFIEAFRQELNKSGV